MINPKSSIVGSGKAVKIRALTKMIPAAKVKQELKNFAAMFVPIIPNGLSTPAAKVCHSALLLKIFVSLSCLLLSTFPQEVVDCEAESRK